MAENHIYSEISAKEVKYLEGTPTKFTVTATNQSDKFASFQLKLERPGYGSTSDDWYKISPIVSSKNPPGDSTNFDVEITKIPIKSGEIVSEKIICQAIVSSIELLPEEDRIPFNIKIEQTASIPLQLSIIHQNFYRRLYPAPEEPWKIGLEIYNPRSKPANVLVQLLGLESNWLKNKTTEQSLEVSAGQQKQVIFYCQPDENAESKLYPFKIRVSKLNDSNSNDLLKELEGKLEIVPTGVLDFSRSEQELHRAKLDKYKIFQDLLRNLQKKIYGILLWILLWRNSRSQPVTYNFKLDNKSNLPQKVSIKIEEELEKFKEIVRVEKPKETNLAPGDEVQQSLKIKAEKAPLFWLFGEKILDLKIKASWSDPRVNTRNETHIVKFPVKSIFSIWFLLVILAIFVFILYLLSWLNPSNPWFGHQKRVNSLQFNGSGERLVSGSDDTDLIEWEVRGFLNIIDDPQIQDLPNKERLEWWSKGFKHIPIVQSIIQDKDNEKKAVRVIRYRPVNNNIVAAGLENGEIQLWDLTRKAKNPITCFLHEKDNDKKVNRVFPLEFSQDSRYLFSGHGNGRVIQWKVDYNRNNWSDSKCVSEPLRQKEPPFDFAVYALKFVGEDNRKLIVAGRNNQLLVWDWIKDEKIIEFDYRSGGYNNYIQSLDTAEFRPDLLVTADNQGYITLWDLQQCSTGQPCRHVEQWDDGHKAHNEKDEKGVRSVALSADGCYLVSGGDDGRVMLWFLNSRGERAMQNGEKIPGKAILEKKQKVNSVDIKIYKEKATAQKILIASGWDDNPQVRVTSSPYKDCNEP